MMLKNKYKKGFSLAESLISMMMIGIVLMVMATVATRQKPNIDKAYITGMYACWYDGSTVKQQKYDGRASAAQIEEPASGECSFEMDRRAHKYYVTAVGRRNEFYDGQFAQTIIPAPTGADETNKITIELGNNSNGGMTKVTRDSEVLLTALPGKKTTSKLIPGNVKSCKMLSNCKKAKCQVSEFLSSANEYTTGINVYCNGDSEPKKTVDVSSSELKYVSESETYSIEDTNYTLNIIEKDSNFKSKKVSATSTPKIIKYMKMLPESKMFGFVTDDIPSKYAGTKEYTNGVVFIIW